MAASAPAGGDRGGTLVLVSTQGLNTVDPAMYGGMEPLSFQRLAYDTLVTFEPAPGPDGLRLVPDLALQVPAPTDGGRTYSFRLRPGIRYSNGDLVKASDFRHALERLFALGSPGASFYSGLVGAGACAGPPGQLQPVPGRGHQRPSPAWSFSISPPPTPTSSKSSPRRPTLRLSRRVLLTATWD